MSYDLIFLLEEPSMKNVLDVLLPKLIPKNLHYICIAHQGKQDLAQSIPKKLKAFQNSPQSHFIILHDQDSHDCHQLKAELLAICRHASKTENFMVRIICHELESWFLGDLAAVEIAYHCKPTSLSKQQVKQKYRDPDRLNSAKQELKQLVNEYYAGTHAKQIAVHLSPTENRSHSFHVFLQGLQALIQKLHY